MLQGKEHVEVPRALPGDICAVAKIDELHFDAVLHDAAEDDHIHLQPLAFPVPVHGLAIEPKRHGDEQRMWEILNKLVAEDPCLKVEHVVNTNETVVYGLGELHLRMLLERLREVYKFEVQTRPPRIAYRETITAKAEGHHRHKKQTGGAGQFGEVFLRVEPLPRGSGFEFVDAVKGGTIPGSSFRRSRRACARCSRAARSPATRWSTSRSPSTTASTTRWTARKSPLSRRGARRSLAAVRRSAAHRARADRQCGDHRARCARWATSPATSRPSAAKSAAAPMARWAR